MKLEEKLISLRKAKGLSQLKLAEEIGVSRQAVSRWETGIVKPSTENLKYLGALYNVPLEYLLNDDAPEPGSEAKSAGEAANHQKKDNYMGLLAIGILIAAICAMLLGAQGEKPISMNDMERSEVETVNDFVLDW